MVRTWFLWCLVKSTKKHPFCRLTSCVQWTSSLLMVVDYPFHPPINLVYFLCPHSVSLSLFSQKWNNVVRKCDICVDPISVLTSVPNSCNKHTKPNMLIVGWSISIMSSKCKCVIQMNMNGNMTSNGNKIIPVWVYFHFGKIDRFHRVSYRWLDVLTVLLHPEIKLDSVQ